MKILVVGFPTPNPEIDNFTPFTAPSYFDYDALVVDPESLNRVARELVDGEKDFTAHDGRPVVNAASTASSVSAGELLQRRAEETQRMLESGATVIVFGRPNAAITGIVGFEGADRYSWLPAPGGASWSPPFLRPAEGKNVRITDDSHPLSQVLREYRRHVHYRAVLNDRNEAFRTQAHTFAVAGPGVPIGAEFPVLGGRVIVMPVPNVPSGPTRSAFGTALVAACKRLMGAETGDTAPRWARTFALPGLEQVEAEWEEAKAATDEASKRLAEVTERRDELTAHRRLLWAQGLEFQAAVRTALLLLGFEETSKPNEPLAFKSDGEKVFVETESTNETVVEWPYIRLQRRLEERMLKFREQPKGVIVATGHRQTQPDQRKKQVTDALRIACENYRYTLLNGETLFQMVQRAIGGASDEELEGMRRRIMRASGLLETSVAVGEAAEPSDGEPIF